MLFLYISFKRCPSGESYEMEFPKGADITPPEDLDVFSEAPDSIPRYSANHFSSQ
jgi:hypothetical protein